MPLKELDHVTAARFSQIDYDRQMALVLTEPGPPGQAAILGVVRLFEDPDRISAEFAIVVEQQVAGQGLGRKLMETIVGYARSRGNGEVFGMVLADNHAMLKLCESMGFTVKPTDQFNVMRVTLGLQTGDG